MAVPDTAHGVDTTHTADMTNNAGPDTTHTTDAADPADVTDADLLEEMANNTSTYTNPEQDPTVEAQSPAPSTPLVIEPQLPAQPTGPNTDSSNTPPQVIVDCFPHSSPGTLIGALQGSSIYHTSREVFASSIWAPFHSQCDWEIACWAKMWGPTSLAMEELLAIPEVHTAQSLPSCFGLANTSPQVVDKLRLSFSSTKELNDIINKSLPGHPPFESCELTIRGERLELHFRDILGCIRSIYSDLEYAQDLVVAPECHYVDHKWTKRIYGEMHTGDWWWAVQVCKSILHLE
jgi:hypothetical protein